MMIVPIGARDNLPVDHNSFCMIGGTDIKVIIGENVICFQQFTVVMRKNRAGINQNPLFSFN
jgi:hypothetical protein